MQVILQRSFLPETKPGEGRAVCSISISRAFQFSFLMTNARIDYLAGRGSDQFF